MASGEGIVDKTNEASWSGVIFEGANDGKVYGSPTLQMNVTLPQGKRLTIPNGSALTIGEGGTLTVNGTIGGNGVTEGTVTAPTPQKAAVTLTATEATYGGDVTFTAKVAFYLQSVHRRRTNRRLGSGSPQLGEC